MVLFTLLNDTCLVLQGISNTINIYYNILGFVFCWNDDLKKIILEKFV